MHVTNFNSGYVVYLFQVQTLIKIAKTNFVVMKLLLGGHKKESKVMYRKTCNKCLACNKSRPLISAGCTGTPNLKNASNYIHVPLINACDQRVEIPMCCMFPCLVMHK